MSAAASPSRAGAPVRQGLIALVAMLLVTLLALATVWRADAAEVVPTDSAPASTAATEPDAAGSTSPEPTDPEPTSPEPTDPEPTDPEPTSPELTTPEPTTPEPTTPEPTTPAPTPDRTTFEVANAQLRWGINNESNNRAFAPGTINLLSAGAIGNPGEGGATLTNASKGRSWSNGRRAGWSATAGNVRIQKLGSNGRYASATWAGLSTTRTGASLGSPSAGTFSDHQVVLSRGAGTVDRAAGTARIQWRGSFTVLYYSGMSYFTVTDPRLEVTRGSAKVTALLGGYGSSMDDMSKWDPVPSARATIADLPRSSVDLDALGFTATPAYLGVRAPAGGDAPQKTDDEHFGSFPRSFVEFQRRVGSAAYWYSSGGAADKFKPALPLTVSYSASNPVTPPTPPTSGGGSGTADPEQTPAPSAPSAPSAPAPPARPAPPAVPVQPPGPALPSQAPVAAPDAALAASVADAARALGAARLADTATVGAFTPAAVVGRYEPRWPWVLGALLLLGAAVLSLIGARTLRTPLRGTR